MILQSERRIIDQSERMIFTVMTISSGISTRSWRYFRFSVHNPITFMFHNFDWRIKFLFYFAIGLILNWYFKDDLVNSGYEKRSWKNRTLLYRCQMNISSVKVLTVMNFRAKRGFFQIGNENIWTLRTKDPLYS